MKRAILTLQNTALSRRPLYSSRLSRWRPQANRVRRPVALFFWSEVSRLWCWTGLWGSDPSAINWQWYFAGMFNNNKASLYQHISPRKPFDGRVASGVDSDGYIFTFYHSKVSWRGVKLRGNWKSIYAITVGWSVAFLGTYLQYFNRRARKSYYCCKENRSILKLLAKIFKVYWYDCPIICCTHTLTLSAARWKLCVLRVFYLSLLRNNL